MGGWGGVDSLPGFKAKERDYIGRGVPITIAWHPGLLIFRVWLAKTNAVLARRASNWDRRRSTEITYRLTLMNIIIAGLFVFKNWIDYDF